MLNTINNKDVNLIINGLTAIIDNGLIKLEFNNEACINYIIINNINITANLKGQRTFYLDWNGGKNRFLPNELKIVNNNKDEAHIKYIQNINNLPYIEYHIIMKQNIAGIYIYVKLKNNTNNLIEISEFRTVCRFDSKLMNKVFNGTISFEPPLYNILQTLPKIQDETWQLKNGYFYSKYDLCNYIRNINYYGVYGNNYGAWTIIPSHEYYSGGPLKQDLIVHQDALMLNYLNSSHFGTPNMIIPINYSKLYGPWLFYFNNNNNEELLFNDVKNQTNIEKINWPYNWINDDEYPLNRGTLFGKVKNKKTMIVLSSSLEEPFDLQTLGYTYHTEADNNGNYIINNIRPTQYKLSMYPLEGYSPEYLHENIITINNGNNYYQDIIIPNDDINKIWNISITNRKSDNFCYSDKLRNYIWQTLCPANLIFEINKNNELLDWFYAQTHLGTWSIKYIDNFDNQNRLLKLSIAGASYTSVSQSRNPELIIKLNEIVVKTISYNNDKSIYRSALNSGNFYSENIIINANNVINGNNIISLQLVHGAFMYDMLALFKFF